MPAPVIRTERLVLRPLVVEDADALHPTLSDAEALRWWSDPPSPSVEHTSAYVARMLEAESACWWAITTDGGEALGYVGFVARARPGARAGFGYLLRPERWGQGLGTEAATAAMGHGFAELGVARVELWIHPDNVASRRLAARLGATLRGEFVAAFPGRGATPMCVYGLRREEWEAPPVGGLVLVPSPDRRVLGAEPVLGVPDVGAAVTHYRDRLGFDVDFVYGEPPDHAGISLGDWTVQAAVLQLTRASGLRRRRARRPVGWTYVKVGDDIDARYADHVARGAEIVDPLRTHPWGMREYAVADPWGNVLRFGVPAPGDPAPG